MSYVIFCSLPFQMRKIFSRVHVPAEGLYTKMQSKWNDICREMPHMFYKGQPIIFPQNASFSHTAEFDLADEFSGHVFCI